MVTVTQGNSEKQESFLSFHIKQSQGPESSVGLTPPGQCWLVFWEKMYTSSPPLPLPGSPG